MFLNDLKRIYNKRTTNIAFKELIKMAEKNNQNDNKMSVEEAGRKGGEATARNHDKEFYQEIGRKGGEATSEKHGKEFYQEIGEKGGNARAEQRESNE